MVEAAAARVLSDGNYTNPLRDPEDPPLGGDPMEVTNRNAIILLIAVPLVPMIGAIISQYGLKRCASYQAYREQKHPALWVVSLLTISYCLLIPGLWDVLFSFNIMADLLITKMGIGPGGGMDKFPPTTETMLGLIHLLATTGSLTGAMLVVMYAIVIPLIKFVLLIAGEVLRGSNKMASRRCVQVVQNISKWACPDMFAYVLLMYLVRGLNHPVLLRATGELELGFTCFSLFCVGSTIAAIGVSAPDKEHGMWKKLGKSIGSRFLIYVTLALGVVFFIFLTIGLKTPVMSLRVQMDTLYEPDGPIPLEYKDIVEMLDIPSLANADVSIVHSMGELVYRTQNGEVNSFIGLGLLAVFCIGFTCLDMLVLILTALFLRLGIHRTFKGYSLMDLSWISKKLSMLDVTIMGVAVVTLCMLMYREQGVIVSMHHGLWQLLVAELIHYFTYYLVKGTTQVCAPKGTALSATVEETDSSSEAEDDEETYRSDDEQSEE